jgi:hypothetical protein
MALNEQTEMAFGELSTRIDPVSGNEVPPGAMPEEVRDDIPAQLSEGEYVVPADVLQYYGIKFFEDLRSNAKKDLATLESGGRMGGEPIEREDEDDLPFSDEELNIYDDTDLMQANIGGMVRRYEEGGTVTDMRRPGFLGGNPSVIKTYVNETGNKMYIRFVNGIAIPPVPPGYTEEGIIPVDTTDPGQTARDVQEQEQMQRAQDNEDRKNEDPPFLKPFEAMTQAELARFAAEISKTKIYNAMRHGSIIGGGMGRQEKLWDAYFERVKSNGTQTQIDFMINLQKKIDSGNRKDLEKLSTDLNGGVVVKHSAILTWTPKATLKGLEDGTITSNIGGPIIKTTDLRDTTSLKTDTAAIDLTEERFKVVDDNKYGSEDKDAGFVVKDAKGKITKDYRYGVVEDPTDLSAFGGSDVPSAESDRKAAAAEAAARKEADQKRQDEYDRDEAKGGGYKREETYENKSGGRYMNKGGLASKKKKSKKK